MNATALKLAEPEIRNYQGPTKLRFVEPEEVDTSFLLTEQTVIYEQFQDSHAQTLSLYQKEQQLSDNLGEQVAREESLRAQIQEHEKNIKYFVGKGMDLEVVSRAYSAYEVVQTERKKAADQITATRKEYEATYLALNSSIGELIGIMDAYAEIKDEVEGQVDQATNQMDLLEAKLRGEGSTLDFIKKRRRVTEEHGALAQDYADQGDGKLVEVMSAMSAIMTRTQNRLSGERDALISQMFQDLREYKRLDAFVAEADEVPFLDYEVVENQDFELFIQ